ncbi:hypothetical protein HY522_02615 [bacterium]|nr:hypothetical protein [bacterium]
MAEGFAVHFNPASHFALRQVFLNEAGLSKSLERLSSGYRVNRASDDAAGLAVSEKMRGQIRGLHQARRNVQDALSLMETADAMFTTTSDILQRMRELMIQSANGIYSDSDRALIQIEIEQLKQSLDENAGKAEFNGHILGALEPANEAQLDKFDLSDGFDLTANYNDDGAGGQFDVNADGSNDFTQEELDSFYKRVIQIVKNALRVAWGRTGLSNDQSFSAARSGLTIVIHENSAAMGSGALANANGSTININLTFFDDNLKDEKAPVDVFSAEQVLAHESTHVLQFRNGMRNGASPGWPLEGGAEWGGNAGNARSGFASPTLDGLETPLAAAAFTSNDYSESFQAQRYIVETYGAKVLYDFYTNLSDQRNDTRAEVQGALLSAIRQTDLSVTEFDRFEFNFRNWFNETGTEKALSQSPYGRTVPEAIVNEKLKITVGANYGQTFDVSTYLMTVGALDMVGYVDAGTQARAESGIAALDRALNVVSQARANLGATFNRIERAMNFLDVAEENMQASESRIRDTDMAAELVSLTRQQVLAQSAQAMLAQANLQPQSILTIL